MSAIDVAIGASAVHIHACLSKNLLAMVLLRNKREKKGKWTQPCQRIGLFVVEP